MTQIHQKILEPLTAISKTAAQISFLSATSFLVLLSALHFIKPEIDPSWRFISEYEIGDYGWIMVIAFLSSAFSNISLFISIRSQIKSIGGRIGLILLLISAAGLTIAGVFISDPVTASSATTHGNLHSLGGTLGIAGPFAIVIIGWALIRNQNWVSARTWLFCATCLALIGFLVSILSIIYMFPSDGKFGPDVLVGWPNRFAVLTSSLWLMIVAWQAIKLSSKQ
jgi:hypothetical protein